MKLIRQRTDHIRRFHLDVDQDASPINCFIVELPPYLISPSGIGLPVLPRPGKTLDDLWAEALATLDFLRSSISDPLYPPDVFQPWGIIQARNLHDVSREFAIWRDMWLGGCRDSDEHLERSSETFPDAHDKRVESLIRALDLLDGAPMPQGVPLAPLPPSRLQ